MFCKTRSAILSSFSSTLGQGLARVAFIALSLCAVTTQADTSSDAAQKLSTVETEVKQADISGFYQNGNLYAGGLPSDAQLKAFAASGVHTVIDFRRPKEGLDNEKAILKALNVKHVNIPLGRELASEEAQAKFAEVFSQLKGKKVLLHCRSGNRVGMMWSLYQINRGVDAELAIKEGRAMGMKPGFEKAVRTSLQQ